MLVYTTKFQIQNALIICPYNVYTWSIAPTIRMLKYLQIKNIKNLSDPKIQN